MHEVKTKPRSKEEIQERIKLRCLIAAQLVSAELSRIRTQNLEEVNQSRYFEPSEIDKTERSCTVDISGWRAIADADRIIDAAERGVA